MVLHVCDSSVGFPNVQKNDPEIKYNSKVYGYRDFYDVDLVFSHNSTNDIAKM